MSASAPDGRAPRPELGARTVARAVLTAVLVVLSLYVIYLLRTPLSWIVIAAFVAIALSGPVNLLHRHMPRGVAILVAYLVLILVPIGLAALIVPPMVDEISKLVNHAPRYVNDAQNWFNHNRTLHRLDQQYHIGATLEKKARQLPTHLGDAASTLSSVGTTIVASLFQALTIFVLSIFMVAGGRRWLDRALTYARPEHAPRIERAADRIAAAVGNYVGGALLQGLIAGLTAFIVLWTLGVPFAAPLAVIVAVFDLIPLVGATLASVLVGVVTLFHGFPLDTIVWTIFTIAYQQIENNVIQPQIQRRAVEIHPFAVLVSVLFGATLFGIVGALLAIPFAASAQIALHEWLEYRQAIAVEMPPGVERPDPPELADGEPPSRIDLPPGVDAGA
ncbi:MAG TPA: AI-2E family transporter [Conexibacter sp.]|nr:AI-2E family transporter [Conexibacter sp.]